MKTSKDIKKEIEDLKVSSPEVRRYIELNEDYRKLRLREAADAKAKKQIDCLSELMPAVNKLLADNSITLDKDRWVAPCSPEDPGDIEIDFYDDNLEIIAEIFHKYGNRYGITEIQVNMAIQFELDSNRLTILMYHDDGKEYAYPLCSYSIKYSPEDNVDKKLCRFNDGFGKDMAGGRY